MYNEIQSADGEVASSVILPKQVSFTGLTGTISFKLLQMICKLQNQKFDYQYHKSLMILNIKWYNTVTQLHLCSKNVNF